MSMTTYDTETPIADTGYSSPEEANDVLDAAYGYTDVPAPTVFECPAYRYEEFVKKVDKANRRLGRAGGTDRFQFTFETFEKAQVKDGKKTGVFLPYFRATLVNDSFRLQAGNHTFVASLIAEEAGYTVHTAPGQSLDGWARPAVDDIHCDICNTVRRRQNIYIVRDEDSGKLLQVGTNCLAPLIGFSPQSLWALTWTQSLSGLTGGEDDEEGWGGYRGAADRTIAIDRVLATSWAVTNGGKNYVSTKAADAYYEAGGHGKPSTVSQIRAHLAGRPRPFKGDDSLGREWDVIQARVEATSDETIAAIKASVDSVKTGTDYGDNLHIILAAESGRVTFRNIGILGSLVAVYAREQQLAEERKQEAKTTATGFLGEVKERIRNFSITLSTVRELDSDWGTTTLMVGKTEDGHVVKWFASGSFSYELGDVVKFEAATVKAHENYQGTDQTVITRGVIDTFEEKARKLQALIAEKGETETYRRNTGEYNRIALTEAEGGRTPSGFLGNPPDEEYPFGSYCEPVFEDVTEYYVDRFFASKADKKRFAEWLKAHAS